MSTVHELKMGINAKGAKTGAAEFNRATGSVTKGTTRMGKALDKSTTKIKKTGAAARHAGGQMKMLFAGFASVAGAASALRVISGFEETIAELGGVTRASGEQIEAFADQAKQLGATTRFTAKDAGEGLLFLSRAGFSAGDAMTALPATLNLASAGMLTLGEAADFASNIVSQFGLAAGETARVADVLVNTANRSNTNVKQLAEAMKYAGPVASALGVDLDMAAAAVGALGDRGIQASLAGTNLRGVLLALASPTTAAKDELRLLGLSAEDVDTSSHDLVAVFKALRDAGLDAAGAAEIFGRRNAAAALTLASSVTQITKLTKANQMSQGSAERLAKTVEDTLAGSFRKLKSAAEGLVLGIGEAGLGRAVRSTVDLITEVVQSLAGITSGADDASASVKLLTAAVKGLAVAFGALGIAGAVKMAKVALLGLIAVVRAHPWVSVVMGVVSLAVAYREVAKESDKAAASIERAAAAQERTRSRIDQAVALRRGDVIKKANERGGQEGVDLLKTEITSLMVALRKMEEFTRIGMSKTAVTEALVDVIGRVEGIHRGTTDPKLLHRRIVEQLAELTQAKNELVAVMGDADARSKTKAGQRETARGEKIAGAVIAQINLTREAIGKEADDIAKANELRRVEADLIEAEVKDREELLQRVSDTIDKAQEEAAAHAETVRVKGEVAQATEELKAQQRAATQSVDDFIASIRDEVTVLEADKDTREKVAAVLRSSNVMLAAELKLSDEKADTIRALIDRRKELTDAEKKSRAPRQTILEGLREELELIGLSNAEQREAVTLRRAGTDATTEQGKAIVDALDQIETAAAIDDVAQGIGEAFGSAFRDIITGAKDTGDAIREAFKNLAIDIAAQQLKTAVVSALSSIGQAIASEDGATPLDTPGVNSALGNAFSGGHDVALALGGVTRGPTYFPMADGRTGLMGEAGPEIVAPAVRDAQGRLGVRIVRDEGGGGPRRTTVNQYITTKDADSFRRSRRQIAMDAQRGIGRG